MMTCAVAIALPGVVATWVNIENMAKSAHWVIDGMLLNKRVL